MAAITPTESRSGYVSTATWLGVSTADTPAAIGPMKGKGGIQRGTILAYAGAGAWGGATVKLKGSMDGTNFVDLRDIGGAVISFTADGAYDFTTSCLYIKPVSTGGVADNVDVVVAMRAE